MGATTFGDLGWGDSAKAAFDALVDEARHEHGHGGYTGTIAEKTSFKLVTTQVVSFTEAVRRGREMLDREHSPFDKWGPAGCFEVDVNGEDVVRLMRRRPAPTSRLFYFFGWAPE